MDITKNFASENFVIRFFDCHKLFVLKNRYLATNQYVLVKKKKKKN